MATRMTRLTHNVTFLLGVLTFVAAGVIPAAASAAPESFGGDCVLYPDNRAATVDSLRFRCSGDQEVAIYRASSRGSVPTGVKNGWVSQTSFVSGIAPGLWFGKTFYTGPDGGFLLNRTAIGDQFQANVYTAPSRVDGRPAWALDYLPSPTPPLYDEIREITPGVWFGYSIWRGTFLQPYLLAFILADM